MQSFSILKLLTVMNDIILLSYICIVNSGYNYLQHANYVVLLVLYIVESTKVQKNYWL